MLRVSPFNKSLNPPFNMFDNMQDKHLNKYFSKILFVSVFINNKSSKRVLYMMNFDKQSALYIHFAKHQIQKRKRFNLTE
jgi:hypothetical protein